MYFACIKLKDVEIISPVRRSLGYALSFELIIPPSKEAALPFANLTTSTVPVWVYSDGSGYEGGIGTSALLYINDWLVRKLRFYLGLAQEHTVYEAKGVGLLMGLHLLHGLHHQLTLSTVLGSDSQATIRVLSNQQSHSGQYILDAIHLAAEHLYEKINKNECQWEINAGDLWKGKKKGIVDFQVHWILGHHDFKLNEHTDKELKLAAQGSSTKANFLSMLL